MLRLYGVAFLGKSRVCGRSVQIQAFRKTAFSTKEFGLSPPPPPPEVRNTALSRGLAAGGFLLFCSLLYKWNKTGDLLDGSTLEDQDVVNEVLAGRSLPEPAEPQQEFPEQEIRAKQDTAGASDERVRLREELTSLRRKESNLRETLENGVTNGAAEDIKTMIVGIETEKAKIKTRINAIRIVSTGF